MKTKILGTILTVLALAAGLHRAAAQGTAFTWNGFLTEVDSPATGLYEMSFALYDALINGNPVGTPVALAPVPVTNGLFTVLLDFGAGVFPGADRWLEIAARPNGGAGDFTTLAPRAPITAVPYAIMAGDVTSANIARLNVANTAQQATAVPTVNGGFVTAATVAFGGSGYTTPPAVTVNDATGSGAVITATVAGGQVTALTVNDAGSGYSAGATITIGAPPSNAFQTFPGMNFFLNPGNTFAGDGSGLTGLWRTSGNTGTTPGTHFLGTTDNQALDFRVNNTRALRLEPGGSSSVNVIGGWAGNGVAPGVAGATVAGGGAGDWFGLAYINRVEAHFGTVSGGSANTIQANAEAATIGGGSANTIHTAASAAAIGGGYFNKIQTNANRATIGGGSFNTIQTNADNATIGGGFLNTIQTNANYATIGGGSFNRIQTDASRATIGGGFQNSIQANAISATISGGYENSIQTDAIYATIGGGYDNEIGTNSDYSVIGGGGTNNIAANSGYATIAGGSGNTIQSAATYATIGGGRANQIQTNADYTTIGGGFVNTIWSNATYATISGGSGNRIQTDAGYATISGGFDNTIWSNATYATISGGGDNEIFPDADYATIGGGDDNKIHTNADNATIGGGRVNQIQPNAWSATIGGGRANQIHTNADYSTIGGGSENRIQTNADYSAIGGGQGNIISNDVQAATIPGGSANSVGVGAHYSFAAGRRAKANHLGSFVWADSSNFDFASYGAKQFIVRAVGGVRFVSGIDANGTPDAGITLNPDDSSWSVISDRSAKKNFRPADGREILERLARLPIEHWNYKWETDAAVPHLGPTAQDFKAAFYPGRDDKTISTLEADGVALAAIQGLNLKLEQKLKEKEARIETLEKRLEKLEQLVTTLTQTGGAQ